MHVRPVLVAVEGIDGAGKTTQIPRIGAWFESHGLNVSISCEPTHGLIGTKIRTASTRLSPALERQYFMDDRREHLETCLLPALKRGEVALTDRYYYSSIAYQGTRADAFDHDPSEAELWALQDEIEAQHARFAPPADILIYIHLDVDLALERIRTGRESLDPFETRQNQCRVAKAFERICSRHPCVITADAAFEPDHVTQTLVSQLERCPLFL